jgi:hypothetical protein
VAEDAGHGGAEVRGGLGDRDAGGAERVELGLGGALAARDDGAGVAHPLARGGGDAGDEADDGLLDVGLDEGGAVFLGRAADLADHDDALGLGVLVEEGEAVDEVGAVDRVAADADGGGLAEAEGGQLVDGLVGEGARARDHADACRACGCSRA